jgi:hypothetical protein
MSRRRLIRMILFAGLIPQYVISGGSQVQLGRVLGTVVQEGSSDPISKVQITMTRMGSSSKLMDASQAQGLIDSTARGITVPAETLQAARDVIAGRTPAPFMTLSDTQGHFEIIGVPPGAYIVRAQRQGYFGGLVNGIHTLSLTANINVAAQDATPIRFNMIPGGAISGRVVDPEGSPLSNTPVAVLRAAYINGTFTLEPANLSPDITDDRGNYRSFGLPPGIYYLMAAPGRGPRSISRETPRPGSPITTLYPNALDITAAQSIELHSRDDLSGINIQLRAEAGMRISGKVINTLPPGDVTGNSGQLRPSVASLTLIPINMPGLFSDPVSASANPDTGEFVFQNVLPGSYDLFARLPASAHGGWGGAAPPAYAQNPWAFGRTFVEVRSGQNIENLNVVVHTGVDVKGRLFVDGSPSAVNVTISIHSDESMEKTSDIPMSNVVGNIMRYRPTIERDGSFMFPLLPEGRYRLQVDLDPPTLASRSQDSQSSLVVNSSLPPNSYVADIRQGTVSVYDTGIMVGNEQENPVEVSINSDGGRANITVLGLDRKPAADATVVLVPPEYRRQNLSLYRVGRSDDAGLVEFSKLAPGKYTLFAWESVQEGAYQNAEFLKRFEGSGVSIEIRAGTNLVTEIPLIRAIK